MSSKLASVSLCLFGVAALAAGAGAACSNTTNPGFDDEGGVTSGVGNGSTGSSSGSGSSGTGSSSGSVSSGTGGVSGSSSGSTTSGAVSSGAIGSGVSSGAVSSGAVSGSTTGSGVGTGTSSGTGTTSGSGATSGASAGSGSAALTAGAIACMPATTVAPTIAPNTSAVEFSPANYDMNVGMGGYAYEYADSIGSTACLAGNVFCAVLTAVAQPATGSSFSGVGVNLDQIQGSMTSAIFTPPATSTGVSYALTAAPPLGTVMIIDNNGVAYQATLTTATGTVTWAMFTVQTPDAGAPTLSGPPAATHINIQLSGRATAGTYSFCITSLGF